jgi:rubrerythrin
MSASSAFDIEKFMNRSGCIDLSDIDWDDVKRYPITPEAIRALKVFMGVEGATFFYLKALLRTRAAIEEPDFAPFMSAWVYEEEFHGRAFRRFLEATGEHVPDSYRADMFNQRTSSEVFTEVMQFLLSVGFAEDWPAVHMAWGAVQECTTYQCYVALEKRVNHPILSKICQRIAKQELKHFAFYFNQAKRRLTDRPTAQRLTRFALEKAWTPVGDGMLPRPEIVHTIRFLFDGYDGPVIGNIERKIQELPGLERFDRFTHYCRQHAVSAAPAHWFSPPLDPGALAAE